MELARERLANELTRHLGTRRLDTKTLFELVEVGMKQVQNMRDMAKKGTNKRDLVVAALKLVIEQNVVLEEDEKRQLLMLFESGLIENTIDFGVALWKSDFDGVREIVQEGCCPNLLSLVSRR